MKFIAFALAVFLTSCTDAAFDKLAAYGDPGKVTCYSGGVIIYEGSSTGAINNEESSDGWYFRDAKTKDLVRVTGDCIVSLK